MRDLISVVIPVYNGAPFLREAIDSIVGQNYADTEVIIVDDGSTDDTPQEIETIRSEYANRLTLRTIRQENHGPSAARNTGIAQSKGAFVAFLDADDLFPEGKFATQLATFEGDPELSIVAGRIQYLSLEGAEEREVKYDEDNSVVHVHLGSMLVRRNVFDQIGVFDAALRYSEDVEWWLRIREVPLKFVILHDITLIYRLHGSNMTRGLTGLNRPFMDAIRKSLARRRQTGKMHLDQMSVHKIKKDSPDA